MVFWNTQLSCTSRFLYLHTPLWFRRYFIHDFTSTKLVWVECYEPIAYNNYCKLGVYPTCYTILSFMGIIWANNQGNGNFKLSIAKSFTKSMVDGNLTNSTILPKIFHLQIVAEHIIHKTIWKGKRRRLEDIYTPLESICCIFLLFKNRVVLGIVQILF